MWPVRCSISLDKPSHIYFVGEKVTGQLNIVLLQATTIHKMNLHLVGVASVFPSVVFEFERLTKSVEMNKILPSGKHSFPISWVLPLDLISSYKWKTACVAYSFHAEVEVGGGFVKSPPPLAFDLFNCIDLNDLPPSMQRPSGHNVSCVLRGRGGCSSSEVSVALDFVLDKQCYIPGELLKFTGAVTFTSESEGRCNKKFPGIRVALEQRMTYLNEGEEVGGTNVVWTKTGPSVKRNEAGVWGDRVKIPGNCQSTPVENYGVICVQYWLTVTASLNHRTSDHQAPQLRIPITIGSIGLDHLGGPSFGLPVFTLAQRPTTPLSVALGESEEEDEKYEEDEMERPMDYCDLEERPETPPPTYEEALSFPQFPPPYSKYVYL